MRVFKFKDKSKLVTINEWKYKIDWENDGASKIEIKFRNLIFPYWKNSIILYQPRIPGSLLRLDFLNVNKKLCVEIDGTQHGSFNKHFHNDSRNEYLASMKRDMDKEEWLQTNNIILIRLIEEDLNNFSEKYIYDKFGVNII